MFSSYSARYGTVSTPAQLLLSSLWLHYRNSCSAPNLATTYRIGTPSHLLQSSLLYVTCIILMLSYPLTGSELLLSLNLALYVGGSEHFSALLVTETELMFGSGRAHYVTGIDLVLSSYCFQYVIDQNSSSAPVELTTLQN